MVEQVQGAVMAPSTARQQRPQKKLSRYTYTDGPMMYLGQQIVRLMQDQGWDAKIHMCYRPPEVQTALKAKGRSKAPAWSSPHQYWLAVDIIHREKGWNVPDRFWDDLRAASKVVQDKFGVELECGYDWGWDKAHIELKNFRHYRKKYFRRHLTSDDLALIFSEVLPNVWKQHVKSKTYQTKQK